MTLSAQRVVMPAPRRELGANPELSIVVPIFNEIESIPHLLLQLETVLERYGRSYEIIAIDDGSTDGSGVKLQEEAKVRPNLKAVLLARNFGQTAALMAGLDYATGDVVITIDADLQNDPEDIPLLVGKIDEGYDLACGWRKDRQDDRIKRNLVSRIANRLISRVSGVKLNDYGCTLKAYRRSTIRQMRLYGEMHRFIPIYASWFGAKIVEVPVRHHARKFGRSKYGLERVIKVTLDLMLVRFLDRHMSRPIHLFGGTGILFLGVSGLSFLGMIYLKLFEGIAMISTPLPVLTSMFFLLGIIAILLGIIAEMVMRTYFESQERASYLVRHTVNIGNDS